MDLTACGDTELDQLSAWTGLYKRLRPLLHTGTMVCADYPDPAAWLYGVVSHDRTHAVYCHAQRDTPGTAAGAPLRFPGLAPQTRYAVRVCPEIMAAGPAPTGEQPAWLTAESVPGPDKHRPMCRGMCWPARVFPRRGCVRVRQWSSS